MLAERIQFLWEVALFFVNEWIEVVNSTVLRWTGLYTQSSYLIFKFLHTVTQTINLSNSTSVEVLGYRKATDLIAEGKVRTWLLPSSAVHFRCLALQLPQGTFASHLMR
jgi:hypothetical protein